MLWSDVRVLMFAVHTALAACLVLLVCHSACKMASPDKNTEAEVTLLGAYLCTSFSRCFIFISLTSWLFSRPETQSKKSERFRRIWVFEVADQCLVDGASTATFNFWGAENLDVLQTSGPSGNSLDQTRLVCFSSSRRLKHSVCPSCFEWEKEMGKLSRWRR